METAAEQSAIHSVMTVKKTHTIFITFESTLELSSVLIIYLYHRIRYNVGSYCLLCCHVHCICVCVFAHLNERKFIEHLENCLQFQLIPFELQVRMLKSSVSCPHQAKYSFIKETTLMGHLMHPLQRHVCGCVYSIRDSTFRMALNRPIIHTCNDTHSGPLLLWSRHQQQ